MGALLAGVWPAVQPWPNSALHETPMHTTGQMGILHLAGCGYDCARFYWTQAKKLETIL